MTKGLAMLRRSDAGSGRIKHGVCARRLQLRHRSLQPGLTRSPAHYNAVVARPVARAADGSTGGTVSLFPAGSARAKVQLPAYVIMLSPSDVDKDGILQQLGEAVAAGATAVLLGEGDAGGTVYQAAMAVKEVLRGRVPLLVQDRTDIASAAEADGVILTPNGVPIAVARKALNGSDQLLGKLCGSPEEVAAAAEEGADLVLLQGEGGAFPSSAVLDEARSGQKSGLSVPLLACGGSVPDGMQKLLDSCRDGLCTTLQLCAPIAAAVTGAEAAAAAPADAVRPVIDLLAADEQPPEAPTAAAAAKPEVGGKGSGASRTLARKMLQLEQDTLIEAERAMLHECLDFLQEASPQMAEISLLVDALKQLDELFLVVVLGEFNSGKSTVINALLGRRFLEEGILPTTNEISVLKYSDTGEEQTRRDDDGFFIRRLPAQLLRELNIVDTPGTNVIMQRQQRLTEEYVPRADLVLFVISADRPFTDSEVQFLRYIRQWGKKVVFVVNKIDILPGPSAVDEVSTFVASNAQQLLGVDEATVLSVSSKQALEAKVQVGSAAHGGLLSSVEEGALEGVPAWSSSNFGALEQFMLRFLLGEDGAGPGESVRLKLQTPLYVAATLLDASRQQLENDLAAAEAELASVRLVRRQLAQFQREMEKDSKAQSGECREQIARVVKESSKLVDSTLMFSNRSAVQTYLLGGESSDSMPIVKSLQTMGIDDVLASIQSTVQDHAGWLENNCQKQEDNYRVFAESKAQQLSAALQEMGAAPQHGSAGAAEPEQTAASESSSSDNNAAGDGADAGEGDAADLDTLMQQFKPKDLGLKLEEDARGVVRGLFSASAGAVVAGLAASAVLPNALEDLLAWGLAGLAGYIGVLNLPMKRAAIKQRLQDRASSLIDAIDAALSTSLKARLTACESNVLAAVEPVEAQAVQLCARIRDAQSRRDSMAEQLQTLQRQVLDVE